MGVGEDRQLFSRALLCKKGGFFSVWGKGGCLGNGCERSFRHDTPTGMAQQARDTERRGMRELRKDTRDMGACLMCA